MRWRRLLALVQGLPIESDTWQRDGMRYSRLEQLVAVGIDAFINANTPKGKRPPSLAALGDGSAVRRVNKDRVKRAQDWLHSMTA